MYPGPSTRGFDQAPVSKGLLVVTGTASLLHLLISSSSRTLFTSHKFLALIRNTKICLAATSPLYYSSARDLICGSFLLYCFRIFERRNGSSKYASFVFASSFLAAGLQTISVVTLQHYDVNVDSLPTGLYGLLFASLVQYYCDVPAVSSTTFLGLPFSGKLLTYIIALQMLTATRESMIAGLSGFVSGLLYRYNVFYVKNWIKLPSFIINIAQKTLGKLFHSRADPPVQMQPMGATLDIQQQQQMEWFEQQMLRRREGELRQRGRARVGQGYTDVLVPQEGGGWFAWGENNPPQPYEQNNHLGNASVPPPQEPAVEVSEEQVQTLVDMGFSRQAVLHALNATNNDINSATNLLLTNL